MVVQGIPDMTAICRMLYSTLCLEVRLFPLTSHYGWKTIIILLFTAVGRMLWCLKVKTVSTDLSLQTDRQTDNYNPIYMMMYLLLV